MEDLHVADRDAVAHLVVRVADEAETRLEAFAAALEDRVTGVPQLRGAMSGEVAAAVRRAMVALGRDVLARVRVPNGLPERLTPDLAREARLWARGGHGLAGVADVYLVGQEVFWEQFTDCAEVVVDDPRLRWELVKVARERAARYPQRLGELFRREYDREVARLRKTETPGQRLIRRVLEDESLDDDAVDHRLAGEHVAVVAETVGVLKTLARHGDRQLLTVPSFDSVVWGWLSGEAQPGRALDALVAWQRGQPGRVAFGEPASGIAGFRASHRQALDAWRVARVSGEQAVRYADVALAAFALRDRAWSRDLVARELGPLADSDPAACRRRETVRVYLELGYNASSAAAKLRCHRSTVNEHVRLLERHRGCPVNRRSAELQLALQLASLGVHLT